MLGQKNFGSNKFFLGGCGVQKFLNRTDPTVGQNEFVKKKNKKILYKKIFGQQKSLVKKKIWSKKFWSHFFGQNLF